VHGIFKAAKILHDQKVTGKTKYFFDRRWGKDSNDLGILDGRILRIADIKQKRTLPNDKTSS
jgi:hypothetical protein